MTVGDKIRHLHRIAESHASSPGAEKTVGWATDKIRALEAGITQRRWTLETEYIDVLKRSGLWPSK